MFLGIPYAESPIGSLRFHPPVPKKSWADEYGRWNATSYGSSCMQNPFNPPILDIDESCLFLNVYSSNIKAKQAPVLVWLHGGGFTGGSGNEARLNGTFGVELANHMKEDFVIVTLNYRLGIFGFLGGDSLRDNKAKTTGNWGLLDQRMAMRWVNQHIEHFGGDPKKVLLAGQSAGAGSVSTHLVSKGSFGLFSKAAASSGAFATWISQSWDEAVIGMQSAITLSNCNNERNSTIAKCLRAIDANELLEIQNNGDFAFGPTIDGVTLLDEPWRLAQRGPEFRAPNVEVIAGSVAEDATYGGFPSNGDADDFYQFVLDKVALGNKTF
eukprot:g431.t1